MIRANNMTINLIHIDFNGNYWEQRKGNIAPVAIQLTNSDFICDGSDFLLTDFQFVDIEFRNGMIDNVNNAYIYQKYPHPPYLLSHNNSL